MSEREKEGSEGEGDVKFDCKTQVNVRTIDTPTDEYRQLGGE